MSLNLWVCFMAHEIRMTVDSSSKMVYNTLSCLESLHEQPERVVNQTKL